jgi:hypothetical protein
MLRRRQALDAIMAEEEKVPVPVDNPILAKSIAFGTEVPGVGWVYRGEGKWEKDHG